MAQIERICPNCGTSNPADRARCVHCGLDLLYLPARREPRLPARLGNAGAAALLLGASALVAREGFKLLARSLLTRLAPVSRRQVSPTNATPVPDEPPDYIIRGWTAWNIRNGKEQSSGSQRFEWHIKERRRP